MNTLAHEPSPLSLLAGRIAAFLAGGIAIVALALSAQGFDSGVVPAEVPEAASTPATEAPATGARRCVECGVIESVQEIKATSELTAVKSPGRTTVGGRGEIEAKPPGNYNITVRMQDGSMRVIQDAKAAPWKHGDAVTIIAGVN